MAWNWLALIDQQQPPSTLFPSLEGSDGRYPVALEADDGRTPLHIPIRSVRVLQRNTQPLRLENFSRLAQLAGLDEAATVPPEARFDSLMTHTRLIVYSADFRGATGRISPNFAGIQVGALPDESRVGVPDDALLVGHVRFEWIRSVRATPKVCWRTRNSVLIEVDAAPAGDARILTLEVVAADDMSALDFAHLLAQRVARNRLKYDDRLSAAERTALEAIAEEPKRTVDEPSSHRLNTWVRYVLPGAYRVRSAGPYGSAAG